jgi:hypothetical protein
MNKKIILTLIILSFFITGCGFDPYKNSKYGNMSIDAWFADKDLGDKRKEVERIDEIVSRECAFLENKDNKYVFSCKLVYKARGETVIPLSKNSTINLYVVFVKESGDKYDYKVYNSSSKKGIWKTDEYLKY